MFRKFFGKKDGGAPRDIPAAADELSVPAVHLRPSLEARRTRIGGALPADFAGLQPKRGDAAIPFLAALDLAEIQAASCMDWLPDTGTLFFFYDYRSQEAWGYKLEDKGFSAVRYSRERLPPAKQERAPKGSTQLPVLPLTAAIINSVPSWERPIVQALDLTDEESEVWIDRMYESFGYHAKHQVGGYPKAIQSDEMELECQLVSHGLYCGDPTGYNDPRAADLGSGKTEWRLLFQIDSDEQLQLMWGDAGMVYFWIREQDARALRFGNAWMILQCH